MKKWPHLITEAAYPGNVGFEEIVRFYNVATDKQIIEMEKIIKTGNWQKFKQYIEKVLGVKLA